jgi:hypothetical protein
MQNLKQNIFGDSIRGQQHTQDSVADTAPMQPFSGASASGQHPPTTPAGGQSMDPSHTQQLVHTSNDCTDSAHVIVGCAQRDTVSASACALDSPQRIMSPDMSAVALSPQGCPATRPLSPLGRVIKSVPSQLRHSAPPDMSKVRPRYLDTLDSENTSRECSPNRRAAHERHYQWRLGQMHADVPDYKSSQARMYENDHCLGTGSSQAVVTLKQVCCWPTHDEQVAAMHLDLICFAFTVLSTCVHAVCCQHHVHAASLVDGLTCNGGGGHVDLSACGRFRY